MDLSRIGIVARERSPWEALDLGIVLARKWYRPLLLGWMIPSLAVFVIFTLIFNESLWVGITITWWLKPVWDRIPLYIASRALFGEEVTVKSALKALPGLALKDGFAWLTWRRFSFTRSFDMPVTVLEDLKGNTRQQRLQVLHIESSGAASWLTIVCVHLEMALLFGLLGLIYMFIPEEVDFNFVSYIESQQSLSELLVNVVSYIAMLLVAPFYTLAGFALYISRRISLESWDIEIRFRHLANRLSRPSFEQEHSQNSKTQRTGILQVIILVFFIPICLLNAPISHAAAPDPVAKKSVLSVEAQTAREDIAEILQGKDFNSEIKKKSWRFKNTEDLEKDEKIPEWLINFIEFLERQASDPEEDDNTTNSFGLLIAKGVELILWIFAISLLIFMLYYYSDYLRSFATGMKFSKKPPVDTPEILFGLDVRKESLPENVPQRVLAIWRSGAPRDALGLLYRATLSRLIHQYNFKFSESDTEKECADIVHYSEMKEIDTYLQGLTRVWQRLAYGHRLPDESEVAALCKNWPEMFSHES